MLAWLARVGSRQILMRDPLSRVRYSYPRTLLAAASATTLLLADPNALFARGFGQPSLANCQSGIAHLGFFCIAGTGHLYLATKLAGALLLLVASGLVPPLLGPVHWYLSWSVLFNVTIQDGGDQATAVLTLLLLPCCLTDLRWHHWAPRRRPRFLSLVLANTSYALISVQVAALYLDAGISKFGVPEWRDGTAIYYFMRDPHFGAPAYLHWPVDFVMRNAILVSISTWWPLCLEIALGMAIFMRPAFRRHLLIEGVLFHVIIALVMGLASFGCAMTGALLLYLGSSVNSDRRSLWPTGRRSRPRPEAAPGPAPVHDIAGSQDLSAVPG